MKFYNTMGITHISFVIKMLFLWTFPQVHLNFGTESYFTLKRLVRDFDFYPCNKSRLLPENVLVTKTKTKHCKCALIWA